MNAFFVRWEFKLGVVYLSILLFFEIMGKPYTADTSIRAAFQAQGGEEVMDSTPCPWWVRLAGEGGGQRGQPLVVRATPCSLLVAWLVAWWAVRWCLRSGVFPLLNPLLNPLLCPLLNPLLQTLARCCWPVLVGG
jgi:hypothetical protein